MRKGYLAVSMQRRLRRGRLKHEPFSQLDTKRLYTWSASLPSHCTLSLPRDREVYHWACRQ